MFDNGPITGSPFASYVMIVLGFVVFWLACVAVVHLRGRVRHGFWAQVFDHSGFLAPVNVLLYAFSATPNRPYPPREQFPELDTLRRHADLIREEGRALMEHARMRRPDNNDDAGFNSFAKAGWKRFYLQWYGEAHPSALRLCPRTVELLRTLPQVSAAMFATLPPGAVLNPHRDPYAGSLRYHLGLITPNDDACHIDVDGERYSWRDGQDVLFDETFIHTARNDTDVERLILFCDVERPMRNALAARFNRWFGRRMVAAAASPNEPGDRVGVINRLFFLSSIAGQWRRRYKAWNPTAYKATKAVLAMGVVVLVLAAPVKRALQWAAMGPYAASAQGGPTAQAPADVSRRGEAAARP